jgi:hypothetical protein
MGRGAPKYFSNVGARKRGREEKDGHALHRCTFFFLGLEATWPCVTTACKLTRQRFHQRFRQRFRHPLLHHTPQAEAQRRDTSRDDAGAIIVATIELDSAASVSIAALVGRVRAALPVSCGSGSAVAGESLCDADLAA